VAQFIGFRNVSEGNGQETQDRGKMVHFLTFLSPWTNLGPLDDLGEKQPTRLGELSLLGRVGRQAPPPILL